MITSTQREILGALIQLYEKKKATVKGEDISHLLKRTPGTIRNQMQTLKALGYVDGVPGPKGGYIPATKAYEALDIEYVNKPFMVHVYRDGEPVEGLSVQKVVFSQVHHPTNCMAIITVVGDTRKLKEKDVIKVGPTPVNHIILRGQVVGRDDSRREIMIKSHSITSIPKGKVADIASKKLISFKTDTPVVECAKVLSGNRIHSAPVIDSRKLRGIVTEAEIVKWASEGCRKGATAGDISVKKAITVDKDERIVDCLHKMKEHEVGRFVVMDGERPVGMITRTDILTKMID